jgi:hypothetical protein
MDLTTAEALGNRIRELREAKGLPGSTGEILGGQTA